MIKPESAPEDNLQPPNFSSSELILTSRQRAVFALLRSQKEEFATIYLGALETLLRKPYDYIAIAAHCLREVMKKSLEWTGDSLEEPKMGEQLNNHVASAWEKLEKERSKGLDLVSAPSLKDFVNGFDRFYCWFVNNRAVALNRAGETLERLQRRRQKPESFISDREAWHKIHATLNRAAHHAALAEEQLVGLLEALEFLLLRYLRPSEPEKLKQIEQIVEENNEHPSPAVFKDIKAMLDGFHDRRAFLAAIKRPEWLVSLIEDGWFDPDSENGPRSAHPNAGTAEVDLLTRLVRQSPEEVFVAARTLARLDDEWVFHQLLLLATQLPPARAREFVEPAKERLKRRRGSYLISSALEEYAAYLLQDGLNDQAQQLIATALAIHPDPKLDEKRGMRSERSAILDLLSPEPDPALNTEVMQSFLVRLLGSVLPQDRLALLHLFVNALAENIEKSIWPEELAERNGYDGSPFWRSSIEDSEQNRFEDQRGMLVSTIRDLAESALSSRLCEFSSLDEVLKNSEFLVFRRIRIHLLRIHADTAGIERVRTCLFDDKARNGTDTWHEWSLLLSDQFPILSREDQEAILAWITMEPDLTGALHHYRENNNGSDPTPKELERWKAARWRKRLAVIKDNIPEDWKAAHPDLCANLDEVEHPTFHYYTSGGIFRQIEEKSPKTAEEIIAAPARALVEGLAHWQQKDRYYGPSEWGLLEALKAAAKQEPSNFLSRSSEYQGLAPARYVALLEGLWESANESGSIDWSLLLTETEKTMRERMLPAAISVDKNGEKGFGISIIRAIEVALERKLPPIDQRHTVLSCIAAFLEHPHPQPSDEEASTLPDKLSMQSLNTPRPVAIRCLFAYDEWLRAAGISDAEEVLSKLARVLQTETTLSGRSVFGEKLNWFLSNHAEWTKLNRHELFPPDAPAKRDAVWNCFVTMCGARKIALDILQPEYERAIEDSRQAADEKLSSDWSPRKGLVRHLCAYYWWGLEPINHPSLVKTFFETAPANLRSYAFSYIGQALANTHGELSEDVSQRFQALADWRIKVLQASDGDSPERQELQGFVRWVDADKLPVEWSLQTLHEVLKLVSGSLNEHQMLPFDFLAKHAEQYPALTIGCMHELTFASGRRGKNTPPWWGQENEAKKILRLALASKDKKTIHQAEEIRDHLLRLGRSEYRNLEPVTE